LADDPVDGNRFLWIPSPSTRTPVRIDPDHPTLSAALHLRFWSQFTDEQIAQVLRLTPSQIEQMEIKTTMTTLPAQTTLSASEFTVREFLSSDVPTDPSMITALVETDDSQDGYLHLEATLNIGDGRQYVDFDFSTFGSLDTAEQREDAKNSIHESIKKLRALQEHLAAFSDAFVDAALEGITLIETYPEA
jgi:hypothetical protein